MIPAPIILYPKTNWTAAGEDTYSTSETVLKISGAIPVVESEIERNTMFLVQFRYKINSGSWSAYSDSGMTVGETTAAVEQIPWSFDSEDLITVTPNDKVTLEFKTVKVISGPVSYGTILEESFASKLIVNIVIEEVIQASADPVTGVQLKRYTDRIKLMIPQNGILLNPNNDFAGCNFYLSLTAGGGEDEYVLINDIPVTDTDSAENVETVITESTVEDSSGGLDITTTTTRQQLNQYYTYTLTSDVLAIMVREGKIPNVFLTDGQTLQEDLTYYFVVTAITFDKSLNESVESPYSVELEASFLRYNTDFQYLPKRSRSDVLFSLSRDMMANNQKIAVIPGSVIRDIADPIALQFERFYVIQDFIFASLSIDTLMKYDDDDGDTISDPVLESPTKQALATSLGIQDVFSLQSLIDEQFDKKGANYNLQRKGSQTATGTVLFYTTVAFSTDIVITDGTVVSTQADLDANVTTVSFAVQGTKVMSASDIDYYYNPVTKRYEIEADIEAQESGEIGNVAAGTITVVNNVVPGIRVTNPLPTQYGSDTESNHDYGNRIKLAQSSYDSGTEGGYEATAYGVPGVIQARVEMAEDPLMMRDYDVADRRHIGGKVDVYIKGVRMTQLTDQVAFKYEYPTDTYGNKVGEVFSIIDATAYRLKAVNPKVTPQSPIVSVSQIRNVTRGKSYDLAGLSIIGDGDTIVIQKTATNINIGMATMDVVEVSYLYRSSNSLVLSQQPVESIVQVTNSSNTIIDPSKYSLIKIEDPLRNGSSSIAKDSIQFKFNENDDIAEFVSVSDEQHDMLLNVPARLNLKGITESTIVVTPVSGTQTPYIKNVDYSVTVGNETQYTYLNLLSNSAIRHGDRVSVSYDASENFNVSFTTNNLVEDTQEAINGMKHACADTIVKQAVRNTIDLSFQVIRKTGNEVSVIKSRVRTAIANYVSRLKMGEALTQGAVISELRKVEGIADVKVPLIRMMRRNSSFISMDDLGYLNFEIYHRTSADGVISYRSVNSALTYKTSENGGDSNLFRGVYENNVLLTLVSSSSEVSKHRGSAYIQGDGKIIVSTTDGNPPQTKYYKAAYYTYYPADENPVGDIETSEIEYLNVDSLSMKDIEVLDPVVTKRGL